MMTIKISSLLFSFLLYSVSNGQTVRWTSQVIGVAPGATGPPRTLSCASFAGTVIRVIHANFGTNCGASVNNRLGIMQSICNGKTSCTYYIGSFGDPAPGCLKDFHYQYQCLTTPAPTRRPTARPTPIPTTTTTAEPTPSPYPDCMLPLLDDFASWYSGDSISIADNIWYDQSGSNNNALISGTGMDKYHDTTDILNELYLNGHPVLVGTTNTIVSFSPTLTYQHTVFNVCKYRESGAKQRIIQANTYNGVFGFVSGRSGIAYEGDWITDPFPDQFGNDWLLSSQTRSLYRGNKRDLTTSAGTNTLSSRLSINTGWTPAIPQKSNFACAEVILLDRDLELDEIQCIEGYLENKYFPDGLTTPSPTAQPTTPNPTPAVRTCNNTDVRFNIHFVMDESNSIARDDYEEQIRFLQLLIYSDINPISKVAILEFSHLNDIVWNFYDDQENYRFPILRALNEEIDSFDTSKRSVTWTYTGLIEAISMFEQTGTIIDPDANLMFLITDGAPTLDDINGEYPCDVATGLPTTSGLDLIMRLTEKSIRLYILGIGSGWNTHYKKVECLANDAYIYEQPNFTPEEFEKIEEEFRKILCNGKGVVSSS